MAGSVLEGSGCVQGRPAEETQGAMEGRRAASWTAGGSSVYTHTHTHTHICTADMNEGIPVFSCSA